MLILARRPGESLVLDGGIRIDVLSTDGRTVRLGIAAPDSVRILRAEIVASVEEETKRAAEAAARWAASQPRTSNATTLPQGIPVLTPPGPLPLVPPAATPPATGG